MFLFLEDIPKVRGEPYFRVCKGGVIYYYFSQRGDNKTGTFINPGGNRVLLPPRKNRLTAQQLEPLIREAARTQKVPPSLIKAVIRVESNFNPAATSPKGAQGLMQLMPETADGLQVVDPYDIRENIWAGTRYLGQLLQKFNYRLHLALAAYNAGPQRVEKCQDVPPIKETQNFVRDVCANFLEYNGEKPAKR